MDLNFDKDNNIVPENIENTNLLESKIEYQEIEKPIPILVLFYDFIDSVNQFNADDSSVSSA